jgi:hypothetical protein
MNHRSLAFRLAVWYALLLSATFALVGTAMFYGLQQYLRSGLADSLRRRSTQIEQILAAEPTDASDASIVDSIETRLSPGFNNRFARVTRERTGLVYRSGAPADRSFNPAAIPSLPPPWPAAAMARRAGSLMESAIAIDTPSGRYLIELGASLEPVEAVQAHLLKLLGMLLPVLVACAAGGGYLLVGWALRPVDRISQSAELMSLQDIDARLPVLPSGDALARLSISLNHMLGRLRESVQTSRRFLADASHELRTPLTVIKGELQEVVRTESMSRELHDRIGSVLEEVARL